MKVISPFYWHWIPTSCTFLSYVIHDQKFPLPDQFSEHLTTRIDKVISYFKFKKHNHLTQEYPQLTYNEATNSKNNQRQIKTTTPQPTLNLWHFPKALFFHYFLIKLNLGYLSSLLSLWVMATNRKSKPFVGKILKGKLADLWKCNLKTLMASILGVVAFIRQPL